MSSEVKDAGLQPAFVEYSEIGARYLRLTDQFRADRQVHAYLLTGPRGIGKRTYAQTLASILFCESKIKPCHSCGQCRLIVEGKHPSLIVVQPEGSKSVSVDRIREVISLAAMHSPDGRERVIVIEPIESLTPQAQNCLLKSLEDPYTNVIYFLLSHDTSALLDTIISRCSVFKLTPWPAGVLTNHLLQLGFPRDTVERAVVLSGGNVGEALTIAVEQPDSGQETALQQILRVSSYTDAFRCSAMLKDRAAEADQILFLLERYLQQCMMIKSGLITYEHIQDTPWGGLIQTIPLEDLISLTDQLFLARKLRMSNVNWQSGIDQLILKILEAKNKWQKS